MLALSQGWGLFRKNIGPFVGFTALIGVLSVIIGIIFPTKRVDVSNLENQQEILNAQLQAGMGNSMSNLLSMVISAIAAVGLYQGAKLAADGKKLGFGDFFAGAPWAMGFLVAFVANILSGTGVILCCVGVFATTAVFQYAVPSVINGSSFVDSFSESWRLGSKNFWPSVVIVLLVLGVVLLGALACVVGLLAAMPVAYCMVTAAYRQLRGEPIAA